MHRLNRAIQSSGCISRVTARSGGHLLQCEGGGGGQRKLSGIELQYFGGIKQVRELSRKARKKKVFEAEGTA